MSHTTELTGKMRLRAEKRLFKQPLLVLQVEELNTGCSEDMYGTGPSFKYTSWRDATIEDVSKGVEWKLA